MKTVEKGWEEFWHRWKRGRWEPETHDLLRAVLTPGDWFVDIGAWIGPVSLWALDLGAKVIAIEPDPVALVELHRRLPAEAEIWEGAVATHSGTVTIQPHSSQFGDSMTKVCDDGLTVDCWTLPDILGGRRPSLAVMDVEGYELTLLPTVAPYLASLGTVLQVALHTELPDPEWFDGYGTVDMPESAREGNNPVGRSLAVVALP
jgi:FkbM family methyltransferase